MSRATALLFLCVLMPFLLSAQQPAPPQPGPQSAQTATLLQQAITAQTGGTPVTDVTTTGTVTVTISPNTQGGTLAANVAATSDSGTITFVATAAGRGLATVSTPSGTRTEIRDISSGSPTLTETGADGIPHVTAAQSALSPHPGWFFPALVLSSGLSSPSYASSYIGQEARNGAAVQHVAVWLQSSQQASQHDIYLDPSTLLPIAMTFTVNPYDAASPEAPILKYWRASPVNYLQEVQFSDYRQVQGRPVAFHIHTSMVLPIGTLVSDVQLSSVSFNTGATVAAN